MDNPTELPGSYRFAVFAEAEGIQRPLVQGPMAFARLIDDVVVPFQDGQPFFIDGVPLTKQKLLRVKIVRLGEAFDRAYEDFNQTLTRAPSEFRRIYGEQYATRLEHVLRTSGDDVTSQVIKAYDVAIKPRLADYLPKREELIGAAMRLFVDGVRALGS